MIDHNIKLPHNSDIDIRDNIITLWHWDKHRKLKTSINMIWSVANNMWIVSQDTKRLN